MIRELLRQIKNKIFWLFRSEEAMTINEFAVKVCKNEGLKKQVDIAQVKEVLKVVNDLTGGKLYKEIKGQK